MRSTGRWLAAAVYSAAIEHSATSTWYHSSSQQLPCDTCSWLQRICSWYDSTLSHSARPLDAVIGIVQSSAVRWDKIIRFNHGYIQHFSKYANRTLGKRLALPLSSLTLPLRQRIRPFTNACPLYTVIEPFPPVGGGPLVGGFVRRWSAPALVGRNLFPRVRFAYFEKCWI